MDRMATLYFILYFCNVFDQFPNSMKIKFLINQVIYIMGAEPVDIAHPQSEFWTVVDTFRLPHIWKKENNEWKLRVQVD